MTLRCKLMRRGYRLEIRKRATRMPTFKLLETDKILGEYREQNRQKLLLFDLLDPTLE